MRGAALYFYKKIKNPEQYDFLFMSGLMSLADLKSLWGGRCPPAYVYLHENQLSYPLPEDSQIDYQFGFTDITTALSADKILFNSEFHKNEFLRELPLFLSRMPEYVPQWVPDALQKKISVIYPGVEDPGVSDDIQPGPPLVIWNHRWEFDKQPQVFFRALKKAEAAGKKFNIALLGENFRIVPKEFIRAKKHFGGKIIRYGRLENREDYLKILRQGDIVISTAIQENFGISVIEAILAGCIPLLPDRLSYPELLPEKFHRDLLYSDEKDLQAKLRKLLDMPFPADASKELRNAYLEYGWGRMIKEYDRLFYGED